ncbi:MAG: type II toxin-antitoxin system HipA family toxin [Oscillospiraceae bacterium]|nr:type II toxin-antitoxin system HipA family toxin [Oscillospiraceae bacterium]
MENYKALEVRIGGRQVGTLALYQGRLAAFEYDDSWLQSGFSISPFSLPLQKKLYIPRLDPFDGLFGVFADSLPDGWGRLLVDRVLLRKQIDPYGVDTLNRLAIVGDSGMGALSYHPQHELQSEETRLEYDKMADECRKILESEYSEDLDELFRLGGSSGGARPKILTTIDGDDWIVKFPSSVDRKDAGEVEFRYSLCAKQCGIDMMETRLFPSKKSPGYFGTRRFDRMILADGSKKRVHMLSAAALLEVSHRIPSLDYHALMKLTLELTKDYQEVEQMYRLMCFNVFAHNRDDHSKNFSFLYDERLRCWKLAPAYDLTYSSSIGGEHATCINGNGRDPSMEDILSVAKKIGISLPKARAIAEFVQQNVKDNLEDCIRLMQLH